ncbi:MAG: hypothetical protein K2N81_08435 [Acetatifactor sp.]|nr:hypothetical protein [Acetatifactor sp.]
MRKYKMPPTAHSSTPNSKAVFGQRAKYQIRADAYAVENDGIDTQSGGAVGSGDTAVLRFRLERLKETERNPQNKHSKNRAQGICGKRQHSAGHCCRRKKDSRSSGSANPSGQLR